MRGTTRGYCMISYMAAEASHTWCTLWLQAPATKKACSCMHLSKHTPVSAAYPFRADFALVGMQDVQMLGSHTCWLVFT